MRLTRLLPLAMLAFTSACGGNRPDASRPAYISWGTDSIRASTIADSHKETVNICLQGSVTAADLERSKLWAVRSVLTWFRAIKVIDERVTKSVALTCENKDLTVNLRTGGGTSFASPSVSTIYMTRPYGTWTHEFGHAVAGLSDTYASGAGSCKSGQPESLMCWGAYGPRANPDEFSTLWPDDIAGIQANYVRINAGPREAPDWAGDVDLEAPIIAAAPWPEADLEHVTVGTMNVEIIAGGPTKIGAPEDDVDL